MSQELRKELAAMSRKIERLERDVSRLPSRYARGGSGGGIPWIDVRFTAATPIAGATHRWAYAWQEISWREDGSHALVVEGRTGTAYNPCESGNTGSGVEGNGVDPANLPVGFSFKALGAGKCTGLVIPRPYCDEFGDPAGTLYLIMAVAVNQIDGACGGGS